MFCSDADLSGDSVIFLAHQWNFFPGKQYTPSDFNEKSVTGGTFLTLGSFGNFSLGSTSEASNGTATYRLTLSLPDTARTYSLYLPEIFSAYTLYLNCLLYTSNSFCNRIGIKICSPPRKIISVLVTSLI